MKKFIVKIFLFSIPVTLIFVFPLYIIYLAKEYYTLKDVINIQKNNKEIIYGIAYNNDTYLPYKQLLFEMNNPDIFVLGASRSFQIRKEFFNSSISFINAGIPAATIDDMKYFIENISSSTKNRVLLLDMDREMFLMDPSANNPRLDSYISLFGLNFHLPLHHSRAIYIDYFLRHKYAFTDLIDSSKGTSTLGMLAFANGYGFRFDGSTTDYKNVGNKDLSAKVISEANIKAKEILEKKDNFSSSDDKNIKANLKKLQKILFICKSKNITVVGFIPPYMTAINSATLEKNSLNGQKIIDVTKNVALTFKENGFDFYDLSDISKYGGSDDEFIDTLHGKGIIYEKYILYLAEHNKILNKYIDIVSIKNMIKNSK